MTLSLARYFAFTASNAHQYTAKKNKEGGFELGEPFKRQCARVALAHFGHFEQEQEKHSIDIARGIALEADAIDAYAQEHSITVAQGDYVAKKEPHFKIDGISAIGCTPDGLVGDDGLLEVKCRIVEIHLAAIMFGIDKKYVRQCEYQLFVTGRKWVDLMYYCPQYVQMPSFSQRIFATQHDDLEEKMLFAVNSVRLFLAKNQPAK